MKRFLSLLLCGIMLLSLPVFADSSYSAALSSEQSSSRGGNPVSGSGHNGYGIASNTDTVLSSVFFASDYQFYLRLTPPLYTDPSITSCKPIFTTLMHAVTSDNHNISTVVIGGDYTQNDSCRAEANLPHDKEIFGENYQYHYGNTAKYSIAEIKEVTNEFCGDANFVFVQGNHDADIGKPGSEGLSPTGAYEFSDYIIYVLNDQDYVGPRPRTTSANSSNVVPGTMSLITDPDSVVSSVAADLDEYLEAYSARGDYRPIFICSHQPIHYAAHDYNGKAHYIFDVVNKWASTIDIVYFFAHTHQQTNDIGGGLSYIEKGGTMNVCDDTLGSNAYTPKAINFTYLNYGFLAYYSGTNALLSASCVDITENQLLLKRYGVNEEVLRSYEIDRINPVPQRGQLQIDGISIEDKTYDGEEIRYSGTPKAYDGNNEVPISKWDISYFKNGEKLEKAPIGAGSYSLVITIDDENYTGRREFNFTIAKRNIKISPKNITTATNKILPEFTLLATPLATRDNGVFGELAERAVLVPETTSTSEEGAFKITFSNIDEFSAAFNESALADDYIPEYIAEGILTIKRTLSSGGSSGSSGKKDPTYVSVRFVTNCDVTVSPLKLEEYDEIKDLPTPKRDGYKFLGWYGDKELTKPFTGGKASSAETVLYAKWEKTEEETEEKTDTRRIFFDIGSFSYTVNGEEYNFEVAPCTFNERYMVPVRAICNALGAQIEWNSENNEVLIKSDNNVITLPLDGKNIMLLNGIEATLDVPPIVVNERTVAPLRAISEALGAKVIWHSDLNRIEINK